MPRNIHTCLVTYNMDRLTHAHTYPHTYTCSQTHAIAHTKTHCIHAHWNTWHMYMCTCLGKYLHTCSHTCTFSQPQSHTAHINAHLQAHTKSDTQMQTPTHTRLLTHTYIMNTFLFRNVCMLISSHMCTHVLHECTALAHTNTHTFTCLHPGTCAYTVIHVRPHTNSKGQARIQPPACFLSRNHRLVLL